MAQYDGEGDVQDEGQTPSTQFDLLAHLSKYNVLSNESITYDELITFTIEDLKDWCDEHNLKTIERRRFLNAVKSLPNAQASKTNDKPQIVEVAIFLGNEEKEQLNTFDEMEKNIKQFLNAVNDIKNKANVTNVIKEINTVCDQIHILVESLRTSLKHEVCL